MVEPAPSAFSPVEAGTLSTVLDEYGFASLPISFVYGAARFLPIKLRAFLDFASPRLKVRLTDDTVAFGRGANRRSARQPSI
jgi:hypothetical protein